MPLPKEWEGLVVITADFETYYDKDYSLRKITPEEYIRDERFEILGVSVQINGGTPGYISGPIEVLKAQLSRLPWDRAIYNNHNASGFDALILYEKLGIRARAYADTLAMGRALIGAGSIKRGGLTLAALAKHFNLANKLEDVLEQVAGMRRKEIPADLMQQLGTYAKRDAHIAYELFLKMSEEMPPDEMEQIDLLARMFAIPRLQVDHELAGLLGDSEDWDKERLIKRSGLTKKQLGSNPQLADAFRQRGVEPGTKVSPTTGKDTFAFAKDDEWMESMLGHEDAELRSIAEARVAVKSTIGASRLARLKGIGERGLLPAPIVYGRAVTHRVGGCLSADTKIICKAPNGRMYRRGITRVMADDLVWDGEEFVRHEGVVFQGERETIAHDGVRGTKCHPVFVDPDTAETIPLSTAKKWGVEIADAPPPAGTIFVEIDYEPRQATPVDDMHYAREEPVYDIINCGPRNRFSANGKLVHNSGKINLQNMSRPKFAGDAMVGQVVYTPDGYGVCVATNSNEEKIAVASLEKIRLIRKFVGDGGDLLAVAKEMSPRVYRWSWKEGGVEYGCHVAGVRDVICSQPGHQLVVADSSNIELRVAHALAGQEDTVAALRAGQDLYCAFATTLYGFEVTKKNKPERLHGKVGMLQLQYQSGWSSFQKAARVMGGLRLMEMECRSTVELYRSTYYKLPMFWRRCQEAIEWMYAGTEAYIDDFGLLKTGKDHIVLPGGLRLIYNGLRREPDEKFGYQWVYNDKENGSIKRLYGGSLTENLCQSLARIVVFEQMLKIDREFGGYKKPNEGVVLTVHDEVVSHIRDELAESCLDYSIHVMGQSPEWWPDLPVAAEGDIATRYAVAK